MRKLLSLFAFLSLAVSVFSQPPQNFSYQAVIRDAAGTAVINQQIGLRISILQGTASGTSVFTETHTANTNPLGIVNLSVGSGTVVSGNFALINWSNGPFFIKVEVDPSGGSSYVDMGASQLLSVPYALHSKTSEDAFSGNYNDLNGVPTQISQFTNDAGYLSSFTEIDGDITNELQVLSLSNDTLFLSNGGFVSLAGYSDTLWRKSGNTIFNTNTGFVGVGITNPPGKLVVQGDANTPDSIPLFEVKDRNGHTVFVVYPDSAHFYLGDDGSKTNKGTFAVSGRNTAKQLTNNFLWVTPDSTRVYTGSQTDGFGVSDLGSGGSNSYMQLTPYNYLIGHNAGENIIGSYNLLLGYQSGRTLGVGSSNICIGYQSGYYGYDFMSENIFLGNYSGYRTNAPSNIFIGKNAGYNNKRGYENIFIGNNAGYSCLGYDSVPFFTYHANNVIVGNNAGKSLATVTGNTILGSGACENSTNSSTSTVVGCNAVKDGNLVNSTVIGYFAGASASGSDNIYIGESCGRFNSGFNNVFIGNNVYTYATGQLSQKFILRSGLNTFPLMFGDFYYNRLVINGDSSHNTSSLNFFVNGTAGGNFAWVNISDKNFKTNILPISNPVDKIMLLNGVTFNWTEKSWGDKPQIGFIAQDVEKVLPEVVIKNGDNYGMQYAPITALLVEGIKAQQKRIDELEKELQELKEMLRK